MAANRFDDFARAFRTRSSRRSLVVSAASAVLGTHALALSAKADCWPARIWGWCPSVRELVCRAFTGGWLDCPEIKFAYRGVDYFARKVNDAEEWVFYGPAGDLSVTRAFVNFLGLPHPTDPTSGPLLNWFLEAVFDLKFRVLSKEEADAATKVFGETLGPREQIILTNMDHPIDEDRAFVWFGPKRKINVVNMGKDYPSPLESDKALLMHELTHVWQLRHESFGVFIHDVVITQTQHEIMGDQYHNYVVGENWSDHNPEQQATIVGDWVASGEKSDSPLFPYIRDNLRAADPLARYEPLEFRMPIEAVLHVMLQ